MQTSTVLAGGSSTSIVQVQCTQVPTPVPVPRRCRPSRSHTALSASFGSPGPATAGSPPPRTYRLPSQTSSTPSRPSRKLGPVNPPLAFQPSVISAALHDRAITAIPAACTARAERATARVNVRAAARPRGRHRTQAGLAGSDFTPPQRQSMMLNPAVQCNPYPPEKPATRGDL